MKGIRSVSLQIVLLIISASLFGQFKVGVSDISVAAQNVEWGVPFLQVTPVHPGFELGLTFLENEQERHLQRVGLNAGYFYHDIIAQGFYAGLGYQFQYKFGDVLGLDFGAGIGALHAVYAGDGYSFNEGSGLWEQGLYQKLFFQANVGMGISYVGSDRFQPFVGYDLRMLQNVYNMVSSLKIGLRINL